MNNLSDQTYKDYYIYYMELEKEFFMTEPYVTIEKDNFNAYSIKYSMLYQSICSEIDCLLKELCMLIKEQSEKIPNGINGYYKLLMKKFKRFKDESVIFSKSEIELCPWKDWKEDTPPIWWTNNNKVKHHRFEEDLNNIYNYKKSNLENVMNALAALYVVEQYYIYTFYYIKGKKNTDNSNDNKANNIEERNKMFLRNRSIKCTMKRWYDLCCYTSFIGKDFFNVERLDKDGILIDNIADKQRN